MNSINIEIVYDYGHYLFNHYPDLFFQYLLNKY